ncbi:MAG: DUF3014 domain-containing protein [Elusimicrobia bacterium]|nr:DUF3014 domain-containing protein [Elusimicrobiota bacterium]
MNDKKKIAAAGAVAVVLLAAFFMLHQKSAPPPAPVAAAPVPAPAPTPVPAPVAAPTPPPAPEIPLPELAQSDDFLREQAKGLSADPSFAGWLKARHLLSRLVAGTDLIVAGKIPSDSLGFIAPRRRFTAARRGGRLVVGPKSFARYDALASAFSSIDAKGAATLYQKTEPLFKQACQELGDKTCDYRAAFQRAAGEILQTPSPAGDLEVRAKPNGLIYTYADDALERLDPVQKLVLRMGPQNERKVQDKVRELAAALGITADQLPTAPAP